MDRRNSEQPTTTNLLEVSQERKKAVGQGLLRLNRLIERYLQNL